MTDDQVIAFAHESDECLNKKGGGVYAFSFDELKRAFEAVAAQAAPAELSKVVELERTRCAAIAYREYQIRENAALRHPMGSDERSRCLAGARAASNIINGIHGGKPAPALAVPVGYKLVSIAMSEQNTQLLRHSLHQITAGDFEPTLQEVAEIYAAATGLETTQPELTVPKGVKSVLICPRCKVDRFSDDCPSRIGCPIDAQAYLTRKATPKDKP